MTLLTNYVFHNASHKMRKRKGAVQWKCFTNWAWKLHPIVFSIHGGMSHECSTFYNRLSNLLSEKRDIPILVAINWVWTKISFALLKSYLLCLHRTQSLYPNIATVRDDVQFSCEVSKIPWTGQCFMYFQGGLYTEIWIDIIWSNI